MDDLEAVFLQCQHELAVIRIEWTPYNRFLRQVFDDGQYRMTRRVPLIALLCTFHLYHRHRLSPRFYDNQRIQRLVYNRRISTGVHIFAFIPVVVVEVKFQFAGRAEIVLHDHDEILRLVAL